jgi:hypothetical protein
MNSGYPVRFSVDFPDRALDRLTTAFRIFAVIPIAIVLGTIGGYSARWGTSTAGTTEVAVGGTGLMFLPPLLLIVFRQKYPRPDRRPARRRESDHRRLPLGRYALLATTSVPPPRPLDDGGPQDAGDG